MSVRMTRGQGAALLWCSGQYCPMQGYSVVFSLSAVTFEGRVLYQNAFLS